VFALLDGDGDGYLGQGEFVNGAQEFFASTFEEQLRWVFRLCDFDGDSVVSREDFATVLSHVPLTHILPERASHATFEGLYTKSGGG
jgi:Ca2+-binding EF-hand superfamily protein